MVIKIKESKKWFHIMLNLVYPRHCPVCDDIIEYSGGFTCKKCIHKIKYIKEPSCMKCGKPLYEAEVDYCYDCAVKKHYYIKGAAVFEYHSMAASIYRFKYSGRQEYADFYAKNIVQRLGNQIKRWNPDALIPVPIHSAKMSARGYNQAEVIARKLERETGIPVKSNIVKRCKKTLPQKNLDDAQRQINLKRAFKIYRNDVKLDTIVIIDDIYTTGSTVNAMARELHKAGIKNIYYIALAIGKGL